MINVMKFLSVFLSSVASALKLHKFTWLESMGVVREKGNTSIAYYGDKSKSKGTFRKKKHIYCKYTETKLISLFNVFPHHFKAPVPAFHKFI
jgi:hypothetical protein